MNNINYLAGFFDGEGCISCSTRKNSNTKKIYFRAAIQVAQLVPEPLEMFRESYGGYIYYYQRKPDEIVTRRPYFVWRLSSNSKILLFLREIQPFLVVKKQQALDMIRRIEDYTHIIPKTGAEDQPRPFSLDP